MESLFQKRPKYPDEKISTLFLILPQYEAKVRVEIRTPLNSRGRRAFLLSFYRHMRSWCDRVGYASLTDENSNFQSIVRDMTRPVSLGQALDVISQEGRLGYEIRMNRLKIGQTQESFARRLGVSRTYLGLIETGRKHPSLRVLFKIEQIFKENSEGPPSML